MNSRLKILGIAFIVIGILAILFELISPTITKTWCCYGHIKKTPQYFVYVLLIMIGFKLKKAPAFQHGATNQ